ncbi:MAG: hypothetical protein JJ891_03310 [Rhizobiaceae bacterium]|nr:hypothetical protein [Rhizobiaceae bacterium]
MQKQPDLINDKLKSLYKSVQEEEIPERFLNMLEQLDQAEQRAAADDQDTENDD